MLESYRSSERERERVGIFQVKRTRTKISKKTNKEEEEEREEEDRRRRGREDERVGGGRRRSLEGQ